MEAKHYEEKMIEKLLNLFNAYDFGDIFPLARKKLRNL